MFPTRVGACHSPGCSDAIFPVSKDASNIDLSVPISSAADEAGV